MTAGLILLGLWVLAVPVGCLIAASRALTRAQRAQDELRALHRAVGDLRDEVRRLERERASQPGAAGAAAIQPRLAPRPVSIPEIAAIRPELVARRDEAAAAAPRYPQPGPPPVAPPTPSLEPSLEPFLGAARTAVESTPGPAARMDWEKFMGVKLFAWVGGFALFLAVAFFVKFSFDNNLISNQVQVAIGFAAGLGLLAGGVILKRKAYAATAHTLCATGVVILYAMSFASHAHYGFTGQELTFGLMVAVTITAFFLAVRMPAQAVAVLGLVGGFLTPPLLGGQVDRPLGLFGYVAILDIGLVAVALERRWHYLIGLAVIGTAAIEIGWMARFFAPPKVFILLGIAAVFNTLFVAAWLAARKLRQVDRWLHGSALALPFLTFAFSLVVPNHPDLTLRPGVFCLFILSANLPIVVLAVLKGGWLEALAGLVATLAVAAFWVAQIPASPEHLTPILGLAGGIALFFFVTGAFIGRRGSASGTVDPAEIGGDTVPGLAGGSGALDTRRVRQALLPTTSLVLPFLLLILTVARLPLANPTPVYGLALVLALVLLSLARQAVLPALPAVGLACVLALEFAWHETRFSPTDALAPLLWSIGFAVLFVVYPFAFRRTFVATVYPWATAALAAPLHFFLVYAMVKAAYPNPYMGGVPAAFAIPMLLGLASVIRGWGPGAPNRDSLLAWFGGSTLFFITLVFPIQFEKQWITVAWALEGAALLWLFQRVPHPGLRGTGFVLLAIAFVRLANPAVLDYHPRSGTPVLNWYLYTYGLTTACLLLGARLLAPPRDRVFKLNAPTILYTLATVLAFLLVNIQIADYFSTSQTLAFQFSGSFARDMTYSIAWALFALGLLAIGVRKTQPAVRYASLGLLSLTVAKLFLHDLVRLSPLYRIGAFLGVAIVSILASVLYQRFFADTAARAAGTHTAAGPNPTAQTTRVP